MGVRHGDGDTRKCVHGVGTRGREMRDLRMRDVKDVKYRTQGRDQFIAKVGGKCESVTLFVKMF